jgi:iron(III) transport system substrate-binding protein
MRHHVVAQVAALAILLPSAGWAADAALIEAAKKEGEVVWYSTAIVDQFIRPAAAAFEKKYGIKVTYARASTAELTLRVINEARGGRMQADVVDGTTTPVILRSQDLVEKWTPKVNFAPRYIDPEGYWVASNEYVLTPGYNTDLLPKGTEPKRWEDLLDPKYKGKLTWNATPSSSAGQGFVGLVMMEYGEQKARAFFEKLSKQNVAAIKGTARQVLDQVIAGEYSVALQIFNNHATISQARGAPVDWIKMEPALAVVLPMSLTKGAPHPNAGKLFFEFIVSDEGQQLMAQAGELPVAPDVKPKIPDLRPDVGKFRAIYLTPEDLQNRIPGWTKIYDEYFR